jgi:glycosyltransferase involved in cell wall biosynthesis
MSAYNAEKTIKRAIDSVLNQTYNNIELIIVNDCSTDNTLNLIKEYNNPKIKLINHSINLGAGCARDTGIKNCSGEYIQFLDSDDYLSPGCIQTMVKAVLKYNADIVIGGQHIEDSDCNLLYTQQPNKELLEVGDDRFTPDENQCKRYLNCLFVKTSLFDTIDYSHRRFCEDTPTLFKLIYLSKSVVSIPYAGYHYTQNPNSLVHTCSNAKNKIHVVLAAISNTLFLREKGEQMDDSLVLYNYENLKNINPKELELFPNEMREIEDYIKNIK